MRKVTVFEWVKPAGELNAVRVKKDVAVFHAFGINYDEFESGPGQFSTAIIEYDNGEVDNVPVDLIQFIK